MQAKEQSHEPSRGGAEAEAFVFETDGVILRGERHGDPDARPALLLHGGGQTRHSWSGTAARLAQEGWCAIALDQRGHGDSDWSPDGRYGIDRFSADLAAVAESLAGPPVLIGASLGGIASLLAHVDHGVGEGLVLVDIAPRIERQGVTRIFEFMTGHREGFGSLEEAADAVASYRPNRPRPKNVSGLKKNLRLRDDGRWHWHWDPAFVGRDELPDDDMENDVHDPERLLGAARGLRIPTLLVRGRESDVVSVEGAKEFLAAVPHARFADVSGAGHMVAGDRNDAFTDAVLTFLREARSGATA